MWSFLVKSLALHVFALGGCFFGASAFGTSVVRLSAESAMATEAEPLEVLQSMIRDDVEIRAGKTADGKRFVIALVAAPSMQQSDLAKARQSAMQRIGEFLGAEVSSEVRSESSEMVEADGKAQYSSFFSDRSMVEVNRTLAGIEMLKPVASEGRPRCAFILSEASADRSRELSKAARAVDRTKPVVVEVLGVGDGPPAEARARARESAIQSAIDMVMGVTLVGMTFSMEEEGDAGTKSQFRNAAFSSTSGFIDNMEEIDSGKDGETYWVRFRVTVIANKIFENYDAHLKVLGNPVFGIDSGDDLPLYQIASEFFAGKGLSLVESGGRCDWTIRLRSNYTARSYPGDSSRTGVQCSIAVQILNARTGVVEAGIASDGRASDFGGGGESRQRELALQKAFAGCGDKLHKALNDTIVKLAREGRPVEVRIQGLSGEDGSIDAGAPSRVQEAVGRLPGIRDPRVEVEAGSLVLKLQSLLPADLLAELVANEVCAIHAGASHGVRKISSGEIELQIEVPVP